MAVNQAHRTLWGRIVLGLFILAWGSASAQPCLMAMDLSDQPPTVAEHGMHAQHGSGHEEMPECEHCPPADISVTSLCAQGINADCGVASEGSSDSRGYNQKLEFDTQPAILPDTRHAPFKPLLRPFAPVDDVRQHKRRIGPALTIKHCVFLK